MTPVVLKPVKKCTEPDILLHHNHAHISHAIRDKQRKKLTSFVSYKWDSVALLMCGDGDITAMAGGGGAPAIICQRPTIMLPLWGIMYHVSNVKVLQSTILRKKTTVLHSCYVFIYLIIITIYFRPQPIDR